jgi:cobyrinic acid a,c-diamide synthase
VGTNASAQQVPRPRDGELGLNRIVIAGIQSGSGKTTVATGIMAALASSRTVQPFKAGPDYIDPSYHSRACGRPSRNLDTWMVGPEALLELFAAGCHGANIAVAEGVMGLFDGRTGGGEAGSTAQLAKLLGAPVVLVVDAAHIARSAAAIVRGFNTFDPALRLAGVILNRIAGQRHFDAVAEPIEREAGVPVLGFLPRQDDLALPERYLGLVPTVEGSVADGYFESLRAACEQHIDLSRIERIAADVPALPRGHASQPSVFPEQSVSPCTRIAVARDAAFNFYYEDNLDLLRAWGAEICDFSPLSDSSLPAGCDAVYIGGGFPELFASELAANQPMLMDLQRAAAGGTPVYGECGGLMYLGEQLTDGQGARHEMAGLVPVQSSMYGGRLSLGYRELCALKASAVLPAGAIVRGHEFHWSRCDEEPPIDEAAYLVDGGDRREGYSRGSVVASYMHLHFGSSAAIAPRFVEVARDARAARG